MGADYLLNDRALVGLSFHYDHMTEPTDEDAELKGNGWLAGPYASVEIGKGVFWNASLLYGGSSNDIDTLFWDGSFETRRLMADTSIGGEWDIGNETLLCLFNMSAEPAHAVLPEGQWTKLEGHGFASTTDNDRVELPAWGAYFARHA